MLMSGNMGKKMKAANKQGSPFVVIAGSDELGRGTVSVRRMSDGEQTEVKGDDLAGWLAGQPELQTGAAAGKGV